jgi:hypothetical protein
MESPTFRMVAEHINQYTTACIHHYYSCYYYYYYCCCNVTLEGCTSGARGDISCWATYRICCSNLQKVQTYSCIHVLFAICTSASSKLCTKFIQWHVEVGSVMLLCNR